MFSQPKKTLIPKRSMLSQNQLPCNQTSALFSISGNQTTPASTLFFPLRRMINPQNGQLSGVLLSSMLRMMKVNNGFSTKRMEVFTTKLIQNTDLMSTKDGSWLQTSTVKPRISDQSSQLLQENGFMNKKHPLSPLRLTVLTLQSPSGDNLSNGLGQKLVQLSF